jgi:hypothetical protein
VENLKQPLQEGDHGPYGELAIRPLSDGLALLFMPSLAALLARAEQLNGAPLTEVTRSAWVRTPIDAFVLPHLEAAGLAPAAEADRRTYLRRLTIDLTGLLPTPEEVEAFVRDRRPDAYERVVERLLASPADGERRAQHGLDVVRFAESHHYATEHYTARPPLIAELPDHDELWKAMRERRFDL